MKETIKSWILASILSLTAICIMTGAAVIICIFKGIL